MKDSILISLSSSKKLTAKISKETGYKICNVETTKFSDGEIMITIKESIRHKKVYIIQSTSNPVSDNLMELLITIDAVKRSDPEEIIAIIPYFGYARQDRRAKSREPITAKLIADLLKTSGIDKVICVQLHSGQIEGFFDCYCENLSCINLLAQHARNIYNDNIVVVSPDHGGANRARDFAEVLKTGIAIIDKRREGVNKIKSYSVIGNVKGKNAIIVDDMIDTAGTVVEAANALKKEGAKDIVVYCVHGVFSGSAVEMINSSSISKIYCTDTIEQNKNIKNFEVISISKFLSDVIRAIDKGESVSKIIYKNHM